MSHGFTRRFGLVAGAVALAAATVGFAAANGGAALKNSARGEAASSGVVNPSVNESSLFRIGTTDASSLATEQASTPSSGPTGRFLLGPEGTTPRTGGQVPASPQAATDVGVGTASTTLGTNFDGITGAEQAAANSAYDLEPPDQGLCSNGSEVVETVNNAYAVYSTTGTQLLAPTALTSLFGVRSENQGTFTSDPRCYYDVATQRWFVTELSIPNFFSAHARASKSYELVAVSDTPDPTGKFTTFSIDVTDRSNPGCPCFGDYPMIGADANGFYVTTTEFGIYSSAFNGVQIYAISKPGLVAAADGLARVPLVVHLGALPSPFPAEGGTIGETYHLSPALTPADGTFDAANSGTEFFSMSDAFPLSSNELAVYALTNTASLSTRSPALTLTDSVETLGQSYQFPATSFAVAQQAATSSSQTPLLDYIEAQTASTVPEGVLQADFDAVEETTYAHGELFTELSNASSQTDAVGTTTAEWFVLSPSFSGGTVSASVTNEGELGVSGQSLLYPDIVVNGSGLGDMVFTLSGTNYFPSAAFVAFGGSGPTGSIQVAGAGSTPEDGFTCYSYFVGPNFGGCRWGDYSGGVAAGSNIWMATEYIPAQSTRDFYTNWGTYIFSATAPTS